MARQKGETITDYKMVTQEVKQEIKKDEPYNCLRKERICVRFVPKKTGMVTDPKHVLYGGMAENAKRTFVVPKYNNGFYANVLTPDEQKCLENVLGLKEGDLNVYKKENNFWDDSNENGINHVVLTKQDNYLDLSNPEDYIKYKILLANKSTIAPSLSVLNNSPKVTYQFVIVSENAETNTAATKLNTKTQAFAELKKIQDDIDRLRTVIATLEKRVVAPTTKIGFLQDKIVDLVDSNPRAFLDIVTDKYFDTKVTLQKAIDRNIVVKRGMFYYDKETNAPLCENGEDPTIGNVCKYLNSAKNDDIKYNIEQRIAAS